jgi:hypothetical protein
MPKLERRRDVNQLAKTILEIAAGEAPNDSPKGPESAATAPSFARRKGGKARGRKLSAAKRRLIARHAAAMRWLK